MFNGIGEHVSSGPADIYLLKVNNDSNRKKVRDSTVIPSSGKILENEC